MILLVLILTVSSHRMTIPLTNVVSLRWTHVCSHPFSSMIVIWLTMISLIVSLVTFFTWFLFLVIVGEEFSRRVRYGHSCEYTGSENVTGSIKECDRKVSKNVTVRYQRM